MKTVAMFQVLENEDTLEAHVLAESVPRTPRPRDSLTGALSSTVSAQLRRQILADSERFSNPGTCTNLLCLCSWCQREATVPCCVVLVPQSTATNSVTSSVKGTWKLPIILKHLVPLL